MAPIGRGYAATGVNTAIFRMSSVTTFEDTQYAAFYDGRARMVLGKRTLGSAEWETRVTRYTGQVRDVHNVITIGVDGRGLLHVSWDHHNNPLNYCQSVEPGSLELTDRLQMTGEERAVCYPQFYRFPDGDLLFQYRTGMSGAGDLMMNRYGVQTGEWTGLPAPTIDGEGNRNAYWQTVVDARTGAIHVSWCWREREGNADLLTNHDLCYARSEDGSETWRRANGEPCPLPMTVGNAEVAWVIPQRSNLANMTSMAVDSAGRPFIASYWRPAGEETEQVHIIYHDGTEWYLRRVGERSGYPFELGSTLSRPLILIDREDRAYVVVRDAAHGSRVSVAASGPPTYETWEIQHLTSGSVGDWEPTHDGALWDRENVLHLFVQKCLGGYPTPAPPDTPAEPAYILEWQPRGT